MSYGYSYIINEVKTFKNVSIIGNTAEHRNIFCIRIGEGDIPIVFAASFHGLEYLTTPALVSFAHNFDKMTQYHNKVQIYFVPMVNPDGVEIALHGINPANFYHKKIIEHVGITDFSNVWQANASGVDINHNFNADWKSVCKAPSPTKYGGEFPESEPETRAVVSLLRKIEPELFIAFHSQGKEIYYDFNGMESELARTNATEIARLAGYTAVRAEGTASFGGAKDWYVQEYHKEAYTVELGFGKNPLPLSQLEGMVKDTNTICIGLIDKLIQRGRK